MSGFDFQIQSIMSNIYQFPNRSITPSQQKDDEKVTAYLTEITNLSRLIGDASKDFGVEPRDILLDLIYYQVGREIQDAIGTDKKEDTH